MLLAHGSCLAQTRSSAAFVGREDSVRPLPPAHALGPRKRRVWLLEESRNRPFRVLCQPFATPSRPSSDSTFVQLHLPQKHVLHPHQRPQTRLCLARLRPANNPIRASANPRYNTSPAHQPATAQTTGPALCPVPCAPRLAEPLQTPVALLLLCIACTHPPSGQQLTFEHLHTSVPGSCSRF